MVAATEAAVLSAGAARCGEQVSEQGPRRASNCRGASQAQVLQGTLDQHAQSSSVVSLTAVIVCHVLKCSRQHVPNYSRHLSHAHV